MNFLHHARLTAAMTTSVLDATAPDLRPFLEPDDLVIVAQVGAEPMALTGALLAGGGDVPGLRMLTSFPLEVVDTRGYAKAEVTAGGVALDEVDVRKMMSRRSPGLFFAGEILDVDGRLGGYNFQWAWSSGRVAGLAAAEYVRGGR